MVVSSVALPLNPIFSFSRYSNHGGSLPLPRIQPKTSEELRLSHSSLADNRIPQSLLRFSASAILLLGLSLRVTSPAYAHIPPSVQSPHSLTDIAQLHSTTQDDQGEENSDNVQQFEDDKLKAAFETYKSKPYALSVPLKVVALRGSVPPSWTKDFIRSQGKRLKFNLRFRGSFEEIFNDLSVPFQKGKIGPMSTLAADIVTIGDSWLEYSIKKGLIEPIHGAEDQDWYRGLNEEMKVFLRRNSAGEIDPEGDIWAAPYRWGSMVIAYKTSKFKKHNLAPIEDWADLWRPELAGRISMVNSPREVIGAVLKHMGASYNTNNIDMQVRGGRNAAQQNLASFRKQVRLFDNVHYLKAFSVGDVWVAVGWSSDVLPVVKRMSNVAVIVPKSGASLWADLWAIPAASKLRTNQIGGRTRGPSPLIHQWIEFCLQADRALPFIQEVIPGASPSALNRNHPPNTPKDLITNDKPRMETNIIAGAIPSAILSRCEFLEPLSDAALSDHQWLIDTMPETSPGLIERIQCLVLSVFQNFQLKPPSKVAST